MILLPPVFPVLLFMLRVLLLIKMSVEINILTKDRSSPLRKMWVDVRDSNLSSYQSRLFFLLRSSSLKSLHILSDSSSPQTKAWTSNTTLRWELLLACDSSWSALSAEEEMQIKRDSIQFALNGCWPLI